MNPIFFEFEMPTLQTCSWPAIFRVELFLARQEKMTTEPRKRQEANKKDQATTTLIVIIIPLPTDLRV